MVRSISNVPYFEWLKRKVDVRGKSYSVLLEELHKHDFLVFVDNDSNRIHDSIELRREYTIETGEHSKTSIVSVLEVLIALSRRINNDILYDHKRPNNIRHWFWVLMRNVRLVEFQDDLIDPFSLEEIRAVIHRVVFREYSANGEGGLFPLTNSFNDQRTVELWYQMQEWVSENFTDP